MDKEAFSIIIIMANSGDCTVCWSSHHPSWNPLLFLFLLIIFTVFNLVSFHYQHDSLPQQPKSDQLEKLKVFKMMLERIITFLQVSKSNISPNFKEKLNSYEKQIINFINTNRPRKNMPGHLLPPHMHSMPQ